MNGVRPGRSALPFGQDADGESMGKKFVSFQEGRRDWWKVNGMAAEGEGKVGKKSASVQFSGKRKVVAACL
jgi:hypothetical protein